MIAKDKKSQLKGKKVVLQAPRVDPTRTINLFLKAMDYIEY